MGSYWNNYLTKKFFFTFCWISLAAFAVYFSSDIMFKLQNFNGHVDQICYYYLYRSIPFFIISMPVVSFFSLIIVGIQIRRRREWHIAKLICNSNLRLSNSLIICGLILLIPWGMAREWALPKIYPLINESYQMIKGGPLADPRIVKVDDSVLFIKSTSGDYDEISFQEIKVLDPSKPALKKAYQARWDPINEIWISDQPLEIIPPSPIDLGAKKRFYIYTDFKKLLQIYAAQPRNHIVQVAIYERLLFIPLFIYYFFIACVNVIRCRHTKMVWLFPIVSLFVLTSSIMGFKTFFLEHGLIFSGCFVLFCALLTPNLFNLYFRRRHKQGLEH